MDTSPRDLAPVNFVVFWVGYSIGKAAPGQKATIHYQLKWIYMPREFHNAWCFSFQKIKKEESPDLIFQIRKCTNEASAYCLSSCPRKHSTVQ